MRTNKFIVFTGPSGVGKATIENVLFNDKELNLQLSCSATTRPPRDGEVDGIHYHFLTTEEFDEKIENDEFIEWNSHFSNKYGTLKSEITRIQKMGKVPFLEIETEGAKNIFKDYKADEYISIFVSPPSIEELTERLKGRGTESDSQLQERISRVKEEFSCRGLFGYEVINDEVERAAEEIGQIMLKEF